MVFSNFFKKRLNEHKLLVLCYYYFIDLIKSKKIDVALENSNWMKAINENPDIEGVYSNYSSFLDKSLFVDRINSFADLLNVLEKKYKIGNKDDAFKKSTIYTESKFNSENTEVDYKNFESYINGDYLKESREISSYDFYHYILFLKGVSGSFSTSEAKIKNLNTAGTFLFVFISNFGFMLFREVPPASFLKKTPIREYLDIN